MTGVVDLGASGVGSKVWVLTIGVLEGAWEGPDHQGRVLSRSDLPDLKSSKSTLKSTFLTKVYLDFDTHKQKVGK